MLLNCVNKYVPSCLETIHIFKQCEVGFYNGTHKAKGIFMCFLEEQKCSKSGRLCHNVLTQFHLFRICQTEPKQLPDVIVGLRFFIDK
jgi:hypothetical protein